MITKYKKYPLDNSRFTYVPTKQSDQVVHRILKTPKYKKEDAIFKSVRLSAANNQVSDFNLDEVLELEDNTVLTQELACSGGSCEIV